MAEQKRVIIDTDPGVDDVLAMLLALAAKPDQIEVLLISVTYGNIDVQNCLRNVISVFHIIEREIAWRRENGRPEGFEALSNAKPVVAVGSDGPLEDQLILADYFHGKDGLGGVHTSHPHFTPDDAWRSLFKPLATDKQAAEAAKHLGERERMFTPSHLPAPEEILRILRENEPDTISIIVIGPMTNVAKAAAADTVTFLRAKEVIVMGGAIDAEGNVSPLAEFNICADPVAAARVFALTSVTPASTLPPTLSKRDVVPQVSDVYPKALSRRLKLTLFPLDITTDHRLRFTEFIDAVQPLLDGGSPLAEWTNAFLSSTLQRTEETYKKAPGLALHDPLCIWYFLTRSNPQWKASSKSPEDIRVETTGQWTRGMCVVDRRGRPKQTLSVPMGTDELPTVPGDTGGWLVANKGNQINRMAEAPGPKSFASELLEIVFGLSPR